MVGMRILVIGATGVIGTIVADAFESRGHEVIRASRTSEPSVDMTDPASVSKLFAEVAPLDAVVVAAGEVPFKPLSDLTRDDYLSGLLGKTLAQLEIARQALGVLADGGSITLTSGVTARAPIAMGAAAAAASGAIESFVLTAAAEAPRGIRMNAVSPDVLAAAPAFHDFFPGHRPVTDEEVARAYVLAVEGLVNGHTIVV